MQPIILKLKQMKCKFTINMQDGNTVHKLQYVYRMFKRIHLQHVDI